MQIYDLETRYLEGVNPNANALTGLVCGGVCCVKGGRCWGEGT